MATKFVKVSLSREVQDSFLTYSLAIFNRALPDCVDGLKTAQRRIILGLRDLNLRYDLPYKKVSRLEGHVLGAYHPQGGCASTAINMGQADAMRYTLTDIHGNVGGSIQTGAVIGQCISEDPPAAARYLEVRSTELCHKLYIDEINSDLGEWRSNYDGSSKELVRVVPALPALLLNGAQGIASGYACYHVPYHLTDVVNCTIAYIKNKSISKAALRGKMAGPPDLAQGGIVAKDAGLVSAIDTGSGPVKVKGTWRVDKGVSYGKRSKRDCITVTSLPYGSSERFLERVKVLVDEGKLDDIQDVQDHSSSTEGVCVQIVLKPGANQDVIIKTLLLHTNLSHVHNVNATAMVKGMPKVLGLKEIIENWYSDRVIFVRSKLSLEQNRLDRSLERLSGIEKVLNNVGILVEILRKSKTRDSAVKSIKKQWSLTDFQASEVLKTPLSKIIRTEIAEIKDEICQILVRRTEIQSILASSEALDSLLVEQITEFKAFSSPRRAKYAQEEVKTSLKTKKLIKK